MKRDGARKSIWQEGMSSFNAAKAGSSFNNFYDVVIVGAGITGITTGLLLAKAGKTVMIAEAQNLGFGTTGGTTAHLNSFMETPYNQLIKNFGKEKVQRVAKAARNALELIKRHVNEYGIECYYKEVPGYLFAQTEEQVKELDDIYDGFCEAGVEVTVSNTIPIKVPFQKAIEIPGQGQFHPTKYIYGLAREFEKKGGVIIQKCRVTGVEENEILEITTDCGQYRAKNLIYATHIPPGVNLLHFRCAPYRSYVIAAKLKNKEDYPDALVYDMYDPYRYYRTQELEGEKFLVFGGEDHKTGHGENTEKYFANLESYLQQFYEIEKIAYRWSSQYFNPTDGLAYIGHLPGHAQNMFCATGYGGIGMTNAHIAAMTLTDLIAHGKSEFEDLFSPNRIKPVAGFNNFMKEAADVVGLLVKSKLPKEKLAELADLAKGEAKVVKYDGQVMALYKDEDGQLHAVDSACTHIKCNVAWNAAEKTWDCPCHGSRFSYDGEMLTAPARKDLQPVEIVEMVEHH